jgi:hypothetical protein
MYQRCHKAGHKAGVCALSDQRRIVICAADVLRLYAQVEWSCVLQVAKATATRVAKDMMGRGASSEASLTPKTLVPKLWALKQLEASAAHNAPMRDGP